VRTIPRRRVRSLSRPRRSSRRSFEHAPRVSRRLEALRGVVCLNGTSACSFVRSMDIAGRTAAPASRPSEGATFSVPLGERCVARIRSTRKAPCDAPVRVSVRGSAAAVNRLAVTPAIRSYQPTGVLGRVGAWRWHALPVGGAASTDCKEALLRRRAFGIVGTRRRCSRFPATAEGDRGADDKDPSDARKSVRVAGRAEHRERLRAANDRVAQSRESSDDRRGLS